MFSSEWDNCYQRKEQLCRWPWSDLVSYVFSYARPDSAAKVLEIGCGYGPNIPFFKSLGVQYYGIDGSETVVNMIKERFPEEKDRLVTGDFCRNIPFDIEFDLVVDRAALTHNRTSDIKDCLAQIFSRLKKGGHYIGIDWFSTSHGDATQGSKTEDEFSRTGFKRGQFAGIGMVHFSDKKHLLSLLSDFEIIALKHKKIETEIPKAGQAFGSWDFVVRKG